MIFAVCADGVSFGENPAHCGGVRASHLSEQEECRLDALGGENVEDLVGIARYWPVVESKYDLLIGKRHGHCLAHCSDPGILARIKCKYTARSKGGGITRTIFSPRQIASQGNCRDDQSGAKMMA